MTTREQLESALRQALPDALASGVSRLADLLAQAIGRQNLSADERSSLAGDLPLAALLHQLLRQSVVGFGSHNRYGDVTFQGDVAGGNILKVSIGQVSLAVPVPAVPDIPSQAPPLPEYFVPRPEVMNRLKQYLLHGTAPGGSLVVSAVHGLGGIGKSTLAAALAHDPETRAHFPDGILWATLGQKPDVLSLLSGWVQALGDYHFRATAVEAVRTHLHTKLHQKRVLLVIDDAWKVEDVRPFLVGRDGCRAVITTREGLIAQGVGARLYDLDVMTPEQALALLAGRLGRNLEAGEQEAASAFARAVGYLPLALELAAAQVADGVSWTELTDDLGREVARLEALDLPGSAKVKAKDERKKVSLTASLNLSLRRLSRQERVWFAWLGVLPEDVAVNPRMAATLWETELREAQGTLQLFRQKALLQAGVARPDGTPTYRLHDLVHDSARRLLTAPQGEGGRGGLGRSLPSAHAELLRRYRQKTRDGLWHTLPGDGYVHGALTWHMEKAGDTHALHQLLREETAEGRCGWHEACENVGRTAAFLDDVRRAWRFAETAFRTAAPVGLALQCRYLLLTATLNSRGTNLPPRLLETLVNRGVWSVERALAHARLAHDEVQRYLALGLLSQHLSGEERDVIITKALHTNRASLLVALAPYLSETQMTQALDAAVSIKSERAKVLALAELASHCSGENLARARVAALAITNGTFSCHAAEAESWARLSPLLPIDLLPRALEEAMSITWYPARAILMGCFVPHLRGELLSRAVDHIHGSELAGVLAKLSLRRQEKEIEPRLSKEEGSHALNAVLAIKHEPFRAKALAELAPYLPENLIPQARDTALALPDDWCKPIVLARLGVCVSEQEWSQALDAALALTTDYNKRHEAVRYLGPYLPSDLMSRLVDAALKWPSFYHPLSVLTDLSPHLPTELLSRVLDATLLISDEPERVRAMASLGQQLSDDQRSRTLAITRTIQNAELQLFVSAGLGSWVSEEETSHIHDSVLSQINANARDFPWNPVAAKVLAELAPRLSEARLRQALENALASSPGPYGRTNPVPAVLLTVLGPHLSGELLSRALEAALAITTDSVRFCVLASLSPWLSDKQLSHVLDTSPTGGGNSDGTQKLTDCTSDLQEELLSRALAISDKRCCVRALASLAPTLPESKRQRILSDALDMVSTITSFDYMLGDAGDQDSSTESRLRALEDLVPHLSGELLSRALDYSLSFGGHSRPHALAAIGPHLTRELLPRALAAAFEIEEERYCVFALAGIAEGIGRLKIHDVSIMWVGLFHGLATFGRPGILTILARLLSAFVKSVGSNHAGECRHLADAILDIGRWFP